jgi:NADH-quinone oxidoreductase subunit C
MSDPATPVPATGPAPGLAIAERLRSWDPAVVSEVTEFRGEVTLVVPREHLRRVCTFLQSESGLEFNFLSDLSVMDRFPIEPRFDVNYQLLSISTRQAVRLRVRLEGGDPQVESVTTIWPTAEWHEREAFDLFGVRFAGHPDLRRILMPENWEGHPLRKDYPVEGFR